MFPMFKDLNAIYENYNRILEKMTFELRTYVFVKAENYRDMVVHIYRCEAEQHNLRIYLNNNIVFNVEGQYSIN